MLGLNLHFLWFLFVCLFLCVCMYSLETFSISVSLWVNKRKTSMTVFVSQFKGKNLMMINSIYMSVFELSGRTI